MDDAIGAFRSRDEADPEVQQQNYAAYWELSADPEKLSKMSEAELYANTPRLGPELTARLLDERQRLQNPDDLADAQLDSDTLIRIARRAGLDGASDPAALGALRRRAEEIFAGEQRTKGGPLGWEQKQAIVKQVMGEDALMPAVARRFFQPDLENAPPGNLSNRAEMLENLLYTRPEGKASAGLVKVLGAAGENDSESNNGESPASNGEGEADLLQVAAQGGTKAPQKQKAAQPQKGQPPQKAPGSAATVQSTPGRIGKVRGYSETGTDSWRAANDQVFIEAAKKYNEKYGLLPNHPGYITPEFLKSWAMIESGGTKAAFESDPFQVNTGVKTWDDKKRTLAGLSGPHEVMTPQKSADAALEWLRYKSTSRSQQGVPAWLGLEQGLKNYNMSKDFHDEPSRMWRDDYHPGMIHYDWYAAAIMLRTADLLRRKAAP